jgi:RimJ/RimL family protein N-acetyltransferase
MPDRLELVPLDRPHLARTREWANDPELMRLMDRKQPVSPVEHEAWFSSLPRRADCAYFAIETVDGRAHIGNVWLWDIDRRHEFAPGLRLRARHQSVGA